MLIEILLLLAGLFLLFLLFQNVNVYDFSLNMPKFNFSFSKGAEPLLNPL